MLRYASIVFPLVLVGCGVDLAVDTRTEVRCTKDSECPPGTACVTEVQLCVVRGGLPPQETVVFTVPKDGANNVSTTEPLEIVFALQVDVDSVSAHVALADETSTLVAVTVTASDDPRIVFVTPNVELHPYAPYDLLVSQGIRASAGVVALPTSGGTTAHFVTANARDTKPPGPVTGVLVDRVSLVEADLSWTSPPDTDQDLAGTLVLRKPNGRLILDPNVTPNDLPTAGGSYPAGHVFPGGGEVAAVVTADEVKLLGLDANAWYDWAFLAMDFASNYSTPTHVPVIEDGNLGSGTGLLWCPSLSPPGPEGGTFHVDSADPGWGSVMVQGLPDVPSDPWPAPFRVPADGIEEALGSDQLLTAADLTLRKHYLLQYSARDATSEYRAVPVPFFAPAADLAALVEPGAAGNLRVMQGTPAILGFTPFDWPGFETQVDTDPNASDPETTPPGGETWAAVPADAITVVSQDVANVSVLMPDAGQFKIRVRPVVPGCSDANWVDSREFLVGGGIRYVSAPPPDGPGIGSDSNDGLTRLTPFATLAKAMSCANGTDGLDIYVAEGTYPEAVFPKSNVRLFGGYDWTFSKPRDPPAYPATTPLQHETIVTGTWVYNFRYITLYASPWITSAIVDGMTFAPPSPSAGAYETDTVYLDESSIANDTGASIVISHSRVKSANGKDVNGTAQNAIAVRASCRGAQTLESNEILGLGSDQSHDWGVYASCIRDDRPNSVLTLTGNRIHASSAVHMDSAWAVGSYMNRLVATDNVVLGRDESGAPTDAYFPPCLFECTAGPTPKSELEVEVRHNLLRPNYWYSGPGTLTHVSTGMCIGSACSGVVEDNVIEGGTNAHQSVGLTVTANPASGHPFIIANNLISAGLGQDSRTAVKFCGLGNVSIAHNDILAMSDDEAYGMHPPWNQTSALSPNWCGSGPVSSGGKIHNNLFLTSGSANALEVMPSSVYPFSFLDNLMIGAPLSVGGCTPASGLVLLGWSGCTFDGSIDAMQAHLCTASMGVMCDNNAWSPAQLSDLLVSPGGADGKLETLDDNDWHILSSAAAGLKRGLDTTTSVCGGGSTCPGYGTSSCGSIATDRDGKARPATPTVGAYEP